jgi:hypothetical protein
VADLTEKLSSKYGSPGYNENGRPIWTDSNNNSVYLYVLGNTVHIVYLSSDAFELTDTAKKAYEAEQIKEEAEARIKNQSNTDGL